MRIFAGLDQVNVVTNNFDDNTQQQQRLFSLLPLLNVCVKLIIGGCYQYNVI